MFTPRDIATLIWLAVFLAWIIAYRRVRVSVRGVISSVLRRKLLLPVALLGLWSIGIVLLLRSYGFWYDGLTKDALLWFVLAGLALLGGAIIGTEKTLQRSVLDSITVLILFEFLVGTYTFSLVVELALVPFLAILAALDAYAHAKTEYASVARVTSGILAAIGITILGSAIWRAVDDIRNVTTLETARAILVGPLLTIASLPVLYALMVWARYEDLFVRLGPIGSPLPWRVRWSLRWRLLRHLGIKGSRVAAFLRVHGVQLLGVGSRKDLEDILMQDSPSRSQSLGQP